MNISSQLRPGNWVLIDGKPMQITGLGIHHIAEGNMEAEGIELTEEIVERCKAKRLKYDQWELKGLDLIGNLIINIHNQYIDFETYESRIIRLIDVYEPKITLHQLQNLYHALTGQELTYKP